MTTLPLFCEERFRGALDTVSLRERLGAPVKWEQDRFYGVVLEMSSRCAALMAPCTVGGGRWRLSLVGFTVVKGQR